MVGTYWVVAYGMYLCRSNPIAYLFKGSIGMPIYIGRNEPNCATNIRSKVLSIELRIFRLITGTKFYPGYPFDQSGSSLSA